MLPDRIAFVVTDYTHHGEPIMYTTQQDSHGNLIVCKGSALRNGYRIIFTGSYLECMQVKVNALLAQEC